MMELKTNSEWLQWGKRDPLFGVASWKGREAGSSKAWTDEDFYAVGESDWREFEDRWRRYGYTPGTFLEIGCGAGRITKQLSLTFARGFALDVSKDMIEYASARVTAGNVEWRVTEGLTIPLPEGTADAVFSCHVLQHLASAEAGHLYFREVFRILKPGGTMMIHLPIHAFPAAVSQRFAGFCDALYRRCLMPTLDLKSSYARRRMRRGGNPPMHAVSYHQQELYASLVRTGFVRLEFATFAVSTVGALHPFVFGTKPRAGIAAMTAQAS